MDTGGTCPCDPAELFDVDISVGVQAGVEGELFGFGVGAGANLFGVGADEHGIYVGQEAEISLGLGPFQASTSEGFRDYLGRPPEDPDNPIGWFQRDDVGLGFDEWLEHGKLAGFKVKLGIGVEFGVDLGAALVCLGGLL